MLQKQNVSINFSKGVQTKSDPFQLPVGNFLRLQNSVFTSEGKLTKRNGFPLLTELPNSEQTTLTTFKNSLIATGSNLYSFNATNDNWTNQGTIRPVNLSTTSILKNSSNPTQQDTATINNLTCLVYTANSLSYYSVVDTVTGQQIVEKTALPSTATNPKAFVVGQYFVITFMETVSAATHLRYIAVPITNLTAPLAVTDIDTAALSLTTGYDGAVANNILYLAFSGTSTTIRIRTLTSGLVVGSAVTISSQTASLVSVSADTSQSTSIIYVTWYDAVTNNGWTAAYNQILGSVFGETQVITSQEVLRLTSSANNQINTILYEVDNTYSYSAVNTNYINRVIINEAASVGSTSTILRSVGLASKSFIKDDITYVLGCYGELNQPTYFLLDEYGNIYMRLSYSNGVNYLNSQVLPSVNQLDDTFIISYLYKSFLAPVNKTTDLASGTPVNAIYTQNGINLAKFEINIDGQYSSEIADSLHLTGGQLWQYDGVEPVEHGFHVYPENIMASASSISGNMTPQKYFYVFTYEWTDNQGNIHRSAPSIPYQFEIFTPPANFTGNRTSGSPILTGVSSTANLQAGQAISGTGIPASTFIISIDSATQITMSQNATSGSSTSTTITPTAATSVQINVPTLRLTYKINNPVRIVGYRWSTAQQTYYQFTSITSPNLNNVTVDSINGTDTQSDLQILGQTILYTTGGVIENIAAPANIDSTLYKDRMFLINAENRNILNYSKQVIQNTPLEFSDLLSIYVAPSAGTQGSTGDLKAISSMDDKLILFKENALNYITGNGPDNTGSNNDFSEPIFISSAVGSSNPNSIILIPDGLMFQSNKGIWLLSRSLQTQYIGAPVEEFNSQTVKSADLIPNSTQVRFILDSGITLVYDYYYQQWSTFTNISAISSTIYNGLQTYINSFGEVYQERPNTYLDGSNPVLIGFTTGWLNLAGLQGLERFYFGYLLGVYFTPFKLNMQLAYDYNSSSTQNIIITPDNYTPNYGEEALWGSGQAWGGPGNVFEARFFPQQQKCQSFQIKVDEIYDPTLGQAAGQGLSLSGLDLIVGIKKGYRTQRASKSYG